MLIAAGAVTSAVRSVRSMFDVRLLRRREHAHAMAHARSYDEWRQLASQLRALEEADAGSGAGGGGGTGAGAGGGGKGADGGSDSGEESSLLYDAKLLREKTLHLAHMRLSCPNVRELMFGLRIDLVRNIANIAKSKLHEHYATIPEPIQHFLTEVREHLVMIRDWSEAQLPNSEKLAFFRETRHAFGRTALLLSGGGAYGTFHMGVVKALFDQHMLPRVLAGSSAGAIVCALISTRTDAELQHLFDHIEGFDFDFLSNAKALELFAHVLKNGSLHDIAHFVKRLRNLLGDLTFMEAYERSGRILNITVTPADANDPPRLLNYLTSPHALVWSAVAASSAFPGLFPAQHLLARNSLGEIVTFSATQTGDAGQERRWRDGSLEMDLPTQALGEMFNCNHTIVSQANPHLLPLVHLQKALGAKWGSIFEAELKHRVKVLQWLLPDWARPAGRALNLLTQDWEGDITMLVPCDVALAVSPITNPSRDELQYLSARGERAAWEVLSAIETGCSVEATLDACMAGVVNAARGGGRLPMAKGGACARGAPTIPSWLHMPAMGMPVVASWGDELAAVGGGAGGDAGGSAGGAGWGELSSALVASVGAPGRRSHHNLLNNLSLIDVPELDIPVFHDGVPSPEAPHQQYQHQHQHHQQLGTGTPGLGGSAAAPTTGAAAWTAGAGAGGGAGAGATAGAGAGAGAASRSVGDGEGADAPSAATSRGSPVGSSRDLDALSLPPSRSSSESALTRCLEAGVGGEGAGAGAGAGAGLLPTSRGAPQAASMLTRRRTLCEDGRLLLAMAHMDCTDESVDVWCALPTGSGTSAGDGGAHDDGLLEFAY
ncbi:hypothetical protein FOA52_011740 [Chlamydomonas sp. UWO 241]|nr:hypothetical protein FOA52_011740 [Chlamydomonas sp. UWO 241]